MLISCLLHPWIIFSIDVHGRVITLRAQGSGILNLNLRFGSSIQGSGPNFGIPSAEGKMKSRSFPESQSRTTRLFELVHSDLKSLLVESYHQFKYFIVFIDDKSSHMWMANLRKKSDAAKVIKNFKAMA